MSAVMFALVAAVFLGCGNYLLRVSSTKNKSMFASTTFIFSAGVVAVLGAVIFSSMPSASASLLFLARGVIDPGIAVLVIFTALKHAGAGITLPLLAAATLITTVLSVVFLGESLTLFVLLGTIAIILGVFLLVHKHRSTNSSPKYLLLAIVGALLIGIGNFITKLALNISDEPFGGTAVTFIGGILFLFIAAAVSGRLKEIPVRWYNSKIFIAGGIFIGLGFLLMFQAFSQAPASIISPLISTHPLVSIILVHLYLKQHEKITFHVIAGAVLMVIGAGLVVL